MLWMVRLIGTRLLSYVLPIFEVWEGYSSQLSRCLIRIFHNRDDELLAFVNIAHIFEYCRRPHSEKYTSNDSTFLAYKHRSRTDIGLAQFRLKPLIICDSASLNHLVADAIRPDKQY